MIKDYFQLPVNSTWVSVGYNSNHTALDLGWTVEAGQNQPIYPIAEGEVVDKGWYRDGGNFVWTRHEDGKNTWYAGYMHMQHPSPVKVGATVGRKTKIGNMGSTGRSIGPHVHFVLVKAPKGTKWSNSGTRKYRVNPAKYVYRFPHQVVKSGNATIKAKPKAPYNKGGSSGKRYINIHKGRKYGTYSPKVQPVAKNIDKWLRPDKFGGMSYEIVGDTKYPDVFLIETRDFGKRQIYLDKSRASITSKPLYKVRGGKPNLQPKPKPVTFKVGDTVTCTAKKDIHGTKLSRTMFDGKKKYKVKQVGRNGNKNHILLGGVYTWVEKGTLKKV